MNAIKFYNVDRFYQKNKNEILSLTDKTFATGQVLEGEFVKKAEDELSKLTQRKFAIAVNSCTDALFFSLMTSGISSGDEVLVPAFSFIASASSITRLGAIPVFVDVTEDGQIDLNDAEKKITNKTKAIVVVHLYGKMINPSIVLDFSNNNNLILVEDAAQALGSRYNDIPAGNIGIASCFSFDPSKIVHAFGTGGMIITDNNKIADQVKSFRSQGKKSGYNDYVIQGFNSRISSLQAALLHFQLMQISAITKKRNSIAHYYYSKLKNIGDLKFIHSSPDEFWNYHKFPIFTACRDELKSFLSSQNIETGIHYQIILPEYSIFGIPNNTFPIAKSLAKTELSLPIYPELKEEEIQWICDCIIKFYNSKGLC